MQTHYMSVYIHMHMHITHHTLILNIWFNIGTFECYLVCIQTAATFQLKKRQSTGKQTRCSRATVRLCFFYFLFPFTHKIHHLFHKLWVKERIQMQKWICALHMWRNVSWEEKTEIISGLCVFGPKSFWVKAKQSYTLKTLENYKMEN